MAAKSRAPRPVRTPPTPVLDVHELSIIEDEWLAERQRGETLASESLLHDEYAGGGSRGEASTKSSFIEHIRTLTEFATDTAHSDRSIRQFGDTAISTGVASVRRSTVTYRFRYLRVYHMTDGAWRLVASQSTALA